MKMKKWMLVTCAVGWMLSVSACEGQQAEDDILESSIIEETGATLNLGEIETEAEDLVTYEEIWYCFKDLDFAIKLPKDVAVQPLDEGDRHTLFLGESKSLTIELRKWDRVSDPSEEALAALVSEVTSEKTELLTVNGKTLVRVNWPHGEVNYYLLAANGDAYSLWITPYVMKEPKVYEKVKRIEENFCDQEALTKEQGGAKAPGKAMDGTEIVSIPCREPEEIDYYLLVDKKHPLPEDYEEKLDLVLWVNSVGDEVWVERTAYKAYLGLKEDMLQKENIDLDLDSAYRSVAYQQDILERFTEKYGAAYAARTVATPGYSEHHTGLAIDLYFRIDGTQVYENEDLVQYPEVWKKIHARLAEHGFILRYPGGKDGTIDYTYEPWHIRYVGVTAAKEIMALPNLSFEDWLKQQ